MDLLEIYYKDTRQVLEYELNSDKLVSIGEWTEFPFDDEAFVNKLKSNVLLDPEAKFHALAYQLEHCVSHQSGPAVKKLLQFINQSHDSNPIWFHDCLPFLKNVLQQEKDHPPMVLTGYNPGLSELSMGLMEAVLSMGAGHRFLEEGCLPVVLDGFKFITYEFAIVLWHELLSQIIPHLDTRHIENAIPVLQKNIDNGNCVSSAVAIDAYYKLLRKYSENRILVGKLLNSQVIRTMNETLQHPVLPDPHIVGKTFHILEIGCQHFQWIREYLRSSDVTSTISWLLTNSQDLTTGEFELLERTSFMTICILLFIDELIDKPGKPELITTDGEIRVTDTMKNENSGGSQVPEEPLTRRYTVSMFRLAQKLFLGTTSFRVKTYSASCLGSLIASKSEAWKPFLKLQEVTKDLLQLLPVESKMMASVLCSIVYHPDYLLARQFIQNDLAPQVVSLHKTMKHDNIAVDNEELENVFTVLNNICYNFLPDDIDDCYLTHLKAAIMQLNTDESMDSHSLITIRNIIQNEYIDVDNLHDTGLIRSLLYFLVGVETDQRAHGILVSEVPFSLSETQKLKRNERIRVFLKVFLGLPADCCYFTAHILKEEKPFIKLVDTIMTSFQMPEILDATDDDADEIEKFFTMMEHSPSYADQKEAEHDLHSPFIATFEARLAAIERLAKSMIKKKRLDLIIERDPVYIKIHRSRILEETKLYYTSPLVCLNELYVWFRNQSASADMESDSTKEYYKLLSEALKSPELGLWIESAKEIASEGEAAEGVMASQGLYYPKPTCTEVERANFKLLGKIIARVLVDGQILDINMDELLFKLLVNEDYRGNLTDLYSVDSKLWKTMKKMEDRAIERRDLERQSEKTEKSQAHFEAYLFKLTIDGTDIQFEVPGYPEIKLEEKCSKLERYIELVVEQFLKKGSGNQIAAIRHGFNSFFPTSVLKLFSPEELRQIFSGSSFKTRKMR